MKQAKAIASAALCVVLTSFFILFPDLYDQSQIKETIEVRSIELEPLENDAQSDRKLFELINDSNRQSILSLIHTDEKMLEQYQNTARSLVRDVLCKYSSIAYSYSTSYLDTAEDCGKLRYVTVGENGEIRSVDLILCLFRDCTVCFEEKSSLAIFFCVSGYFAEAILQYAQEDVLQSIFEYYDAHGLLDSYKESGFLPANFLEADEFELPKYEQLLKYYYGSEIWFGDYDFAWRFDRWRESTQYDELY